MSYLSRVYWRCRLSLTITRAVLGVLPGKLTSLDNLPPGFVAYFVYESVSRTLEAYLQSEADEGDRQVV